MKRDISLLREYIALLLEDTKTSWNFGLADAKEEYAAAREELLARLSKEDRAAAQGDLVKWLEKNPRPKSHVYRFMRALRDLQMLGDESVGFYMQSDDKEIAPLLPEKLFHGRYSMSDIDPCQWYAWPKDMKKKAGDFKKGGPGEEWLAYLFNGRVQGSRVSYDVAIHPDNGGGRYEVKEIPSRTGAGELESGEIRLGTEGMQAMRRLRLSLSKSVTQMSNFLRRLSKDPSFTQDVRVAKVQNFITHNKSDIVDSGEVTQERAKHFVATLRAVRSLLERPPLDVDRGVWAKSIEVLQHDLFKTVDLDRFGEYVSDNFDVTAGFTQVDGVFVVVPPESNGGGFIYIPKDKLADVFVLSAATQGYRPKFKVIPPSSATVELKKRA